MVLTIADINHFRTFGHVLLRRFLSPEDAQGLRAEVTGSLRNAFGCAFRDPVDGLPGLLLPTMSPETPLGISLVADDTRFWDAAHMLMGAQCVPVASEANCFYRNAGWHSDSGHTTRSVKFMAYLDPMEEGRGALEVLSGSHQETWQRDIRQFLAGAPERRGTAEGSESFGQWHVPGLALPTEPGDVVAFDGRLLHRSSGGGTRVAWNVQYVGEPPRTSAAERFAVRDFVAHSSNTESYPYDHNRWPVWDYWVKNLERSPARATAIARLEGLRVFDVGGIGVGKPTIRPDDANGANDWVTGVPHWVAKARSSPRPAPHLGRPETRGGR